MVAVVGVAVARGWRAAGEGEGEGEVGIEETWRRERVVLRLRRDFISRGIEPLLLVMMMTILEKFDGT